MAAALPMESVVQEKEKPMELTHKPFTIGALLPLVAVLLGLLVTISTVYGQEAGDKPVLQIETSLGTMVAELDAEKAPESVENFLQYVDDKYFDGTIFHRVIKDFMIQGGGFTINMTRKPTRAAVQNEAKNGLKNKRGTLAMARTSDPHSGTSQFFINHRDNAFLDYPGQDGWGYAVFGKLVSGEDVLDKIAGVKTGSGDVPGEPVVIQSVRRVQEEE
jgi:cyclophilin family peptidyl-prolyl cis-trans isomerase